MKTLFDEKTFEEINLRLEKLNGKSQRQWGKMSVGQMLKHCSSALEVATGDVNYPRVFLGYVLGGIAKKSMLGEKPFRRNSPTDKHFIFTDERDFSKEKEQLLVLITKFHKGGEKGTTSRPHTFFGPMTPTEWGMLMWKHLDHHFTQFGV